MRKQRWSWNKESSKEGICDIAPTDIIVENDGVLKDETYHICPDCGKLAKFLTGSERTRWFKCGVCKKVFRVIFEKRKKKK